jgi:hypothetical protein
VFLAISADDAEVDLTRRAPRFAPPAGPRQLIWYTTRRRA